MSDSKAKEQVVFDYEEFGSVEKKEILTPEDMLEQLVVHSAKAAL